MLDDDGCGCDVGMVLVDLASSLGIGRLYW